LSNKDPAELPGRIAELRQRIAAAGRDPGGLEITVFGLERSATAERVAEYGAMGADRVVLRPRIGSLEEFAAFLDAYRDLLVS